MKPEVLQYLLNLSRQMATTRSLQPLLEYAMDEAIRLVGAERGYLMLLDAAGTLDFRVTRAQGTETFAYTEDLISMTILQDVIISRQPVFIRNAMADAKWKQSKSVVMLRLRSVICVPLVNHGACMGAIYVENRSVDSRFEEDDLIPLMLFADQCAVHIENANLYASLEQQVADRTESLHREIQERLRIEEALRQSLTELEASNRELDAFAHTVAHDLKNPVSLISGSADLLMEDGATLSDDSRQSLIAIITRTAYKMNDIIDALLLLSGVRVQPIKVEALKMSSIVDETLIRLAKVIADAGAQITLPETWVEAYGYAPWVEEVWVNYISNACKYGGNPPCIELGSALDADGMARFWVQDQGTGLAAALIPDLFLPFTRLNTTPLPGSGLGLSIVRRIVEKLGGQVGVVSPGLGYGSTFFFMLPTTAPD